MSKNPPSGLGPLLAPVSKTALPGLLSCFIRLPLVMRPVGWL